MRGMNIAAELSGQIRQLPELLSRAMGKGIDPRRWNPLTLALILSIAVDCAELAMESSSQQSPVGTATNSSSEMFPEVSEFWNQYIRAHPNAEEQYVMLKYGSSEARRAKDKSPVQELKACSPDEFCRFRCLQSTDRPAILSLYLRRSHANQMEGPDVPPAEREPYRNLENAEAVIFLILRDMALPLLCEDEPQWRPCSEMNRLASTTMLTQLDISVDGRWGLYARCPSGAVCHDPELTAETSLSTRSQEHCPPVRYIPGRAELTSRYRRPAGARCRRTGSRFADCDQLWAVWHYELSQLLHAGQLVSLPPCRRRMDLSAVAEERLTANAGGGGGGGGGDAAASDRTKVRAHHSSLDAGTPAVTGAAGEFQVAGGCGWEWMSRGKTVAMSCLRDRLTRAVEGLDPACFDRCRRAGVLRPSEPRYIRCFFGALLGNTTAAAAPPAAAHHDSASDDGSIRSGGHGAADSVSPGSPAPAAADVAAATAWITGSGPGESVEGRVRAVLLQAWHYAFLNPAGGGCPGE